MRLRGTVIGGLSLFRAGPGKMGAGDIEVAQAFADVATIAILQHRAAYEAQVINEQLNKAPEGRIVIEQAKGVLAERGSVGMEDAFGCLRGYARARNLRLSDVARAVVEGDLAGSVLAHG